MTTRAIDALDDVYPREHEFRFTNFSRRDLPVSMQYRDKDVPPTVGETSGLDARIGTRMSLLQVGRKTRMTLLPDKT